jgi:hypothetical protein
MEQRLSIYELGGKSSTLAGTPRGKQLLAALITKVSRSAEPIAIFLDFEGVDVATGSFLREAVLGFRDYCRNGELNLFPVVANAGSNIIDELNMVLELRGDAIVVCNINGNGHVTSAEVLGSLEEKQQITLAAVLQEKETDATTLQEKYRDSEPIKVTGWNNRLSALVEKGILMEVKRGRGKVYRPVLEMS